MKCFFYIFFRLKYILDLCIVFKELFVLNNIRECVKVYVVKYYL